MVKEEEKHLHKGDSFKIDIRFDVGKERVGKKRINKG